MHTLHENTTNIRDPTLRAEAFPEKPIESSTKARQLPLPDRTWSMLVVFSWRKPRALRPAFAQRPPSDVVSQMEMRGIADVRRVFVEVAPVVWSATSR